MNEVILICEREDTIILVDPISFAVQRVGYNHCFMSDPVARARSRQSIVDVLRTGVGPCVVLTGQSAAMLYLALAGHAYTMQQPGDAHEDLARQARAHISRHRKDEEQWEIAARVVETWGDFIMPWLGVTKLVEGVPQMGSPEYETRIYL